MTSLNTAADLIAALPALPHGKGALILILGGLLMLSVALLWSMVQPTAHPSAQPHARTRRHAAPANVAQRPPGAMPHVDWTTQRAAHHLDPLLQEARRLGIGQTTILATWPDRSLVRLDDCPSCRMHADPGPECRESGRVLHEAARRSGRQVTTQERRCRGREHNACVFEIAWGGTA